MKREIKCRIWRGEHTDENPYDDDYGYEYFDLSKKIKECFSGKVEHYPYSVDSGFTLPDSVDGYIVIGNIHENPELMEHKG